VFDLIAQVLDTKEAFPSASNDSERLVEIAQEFDEHWRFRSAADLSIMILKMLYAAPPGFVETLVRVLREEVEWQLQRILTAPSDRQERPY